MKAERTWFVLAVLAAATLLTVLGKLQGPDWVKLVLVLAGIVAHAAALASPAPEAAP